MKKSDFFSFFISFILLFGMILTSFYLRPPNSYALLDFNLNPSYQVNSSFSGKVILTIQQGDSIPVNTHVNIYLIKDKEIIAESIQTMDEFVNGEDTPVELFNSTNDSLGYFYKKPRTFTRDLENLVFYRLTEEGNYTAEITIPELNVTLDKKFTVDSDDKTIKIAQNKKIQIFSGYNENNNVLCVYNNNIDTSKQICDYYLSKRPGAYELGLNIPDNAFSDNHHESMTNITNFDYYVKSPILNWINNNPDKTIVYLTMAKYVPYKVGNYDPGYGSGPGKSAGMYLSVGSSFNWEDNENLTPNPFYGLKENFDPFNSSKPYYGKLRFIVTYLNAFSLEDVKTMLDKAVGNAPNLSTVKWAKDYPTGNNPPIGISFDNYRPNLDPNSPYIDTNESIISFATGGTNKGGYPYYWYWATNTVKINPSNRSSIYVEESVDAATFNGTSTNHTIGYQSLLGDYFSPNAFGGTNYSNSFSGSIGNVGEPTIGIYALPNYNIFQTNYIYGLNFGTSQMSSVGSIDWMQLIVGDPLMVANENNNFLLPFSGDQCNTYSDCRTGNYCNEDSNGIKRCHPTQSACIFDSTGSEIINNDQYCFSNSTQANIRQCINGAWQSPIECGQDYFCKNNQCVKGEFKLCNFNSECDSGYCAQDLNGIKRCTRAGLCTIDSSGDIAGNYNYACKNDTSKIKCLANGTWDNTTIDCPSGCENGFCLGEWFTSPSTFNFIGDHNYGITLPINPTNNDLISLFPNVSNDSQIYTTYNGTFYTLTYSTLIKNSTRVWRWSVNKTLDRNYDPMPSGKGFLFTPKLGNYTFTIVGENFTSPFPILIIGKANYIGIPFCSENYTASKVIDEVSSIDSSCNSISMMETANGPIQWWSNNESYTQSGTKKDFQIRNYESYILYCSDSSNFLWTPSCNPLMDTSEKKYFIPPKNNKITVTNKINDSIKNINSLTFESNETKNLTADNVTITQQKENNYSNIIINIILVTIIVVILLIIYRLFEPKNNIIQTIENNKNTLENNQTRW